MKLEILILTQPSREHFLEQLLAILEPQCTGLDVGIKISKWNDWYSFGGNRELMRQASTGEYIAFQDDDDIPVGDYIPRIFSLLDGVDYVGYKVQTWVRSQKGCIAKHSLSCPGWNSQPGWQKRPNEILERDIVHWNPMRRELALAVPMEGGRGEDERWGRAMSAKGIVKTEHFIDDVMVHYLWRKPKNDATDWRAPYRLQLIKEIMAGQYEAIT